MAGARVPERWPRSEGSQGRINRASLALRSLRREQETAYRHKSLEDFNGQEFDVDVSMVCGDGCTLERSRSRA